MKKVFIDGMSGTTGLEIHDRLKGRRDIEILEIAEENRKDPAAKREILEAADLAVLCLPDEAAKETVELARDLSVKILDASTAHRVAEGWTYGLPELCAGQRERIANARLVANPGCYPTGALLALRPLVDQGILDQKTLVRINAVSGYSGGGKQMIESYQEAQGAENLGFRPYALGMQHKHLPEMTLYSKLEHAPLFVPSVSDFYKGMLVMIPFFKSELKLDGDLEMGIYEAWQKAYRDESFIKVMEPRLEGLTNQGFLEALSCNDGNRVDLMVFGNEEQCLLVARLDNLGKGASGAAVQNLNLMLDLAEGLGL